MSYVLVLQWSAASIEDFDDLIEIEDALEQGLDQAIGSVDGHDMGSGEMNIFIYTNEPRAAFDAASQVMRKNAHWATVRAAARALDADRFDIIWPTSLEVFSVA